jgi:hypothetical protein
MSKKIKGIFFILIASISLCFGQELNCKVTINSQKASKTDPKVFKTLEQALNDFMNGTKWSNDNFKPFEKIECSILLTIETEPKENSFTASLTITSSRPVFNSDYRTPLMNYKDRSFEFTYKENDALDFNENTYNNNLTHTFGYYAFVILGMDYDTYAPSGGTPFFNKAEVLCQLAQNASSDAGWKNNFGERTRTNLIAEIQNNRYRTFREVLYTYHLKGLDVMYDDVVKGRTAISNAINLLSGINTDNSNTMIVQLFTQAKSNEITSIFETAEKSEKEVTFKTMSKIDATNTQKYQNAILKTK